MDGRRLAFILLVAAAWRPAAARSLALDPFLSPSPDSFEEPATFALSNDSFGPGPIDEWDDLDSFGMRVSVPAGSARVLAAIDGLTNRDTVPANASRIDEASIGAAWHLVSGAPLWVSLASGLDATGDFGGLAIQEGFHGDTGVARPVPTDYSAGFGLAPLAGFKLTLSSAAAWSPYVVVSGRGSIPTRGSLLAVTGLRYARPGALLAIGGGWRAAGGAAPCPTLAAVDAAENGPYLGLEIRVGLLDLSFEDIPRLRKTNGTLGFVLGKPLRAQPGVNPLSLDLGLLVGSSVAEQVRLALGVAGAERELHAQAFVGFAQGWFGSDRPEDTVTLFADYSAGGSVSLPIAGGLLFLDAGLGPFFSFEQLSTATLASSVPLGYRDSFGLQAEAGTRVMLPSEKLPLGLGWRVRWRPLQAVVLQTQEAFAQRTPIDFELFICSTN